MKKIIAVLMTAALLLAGLAGCAKEETPDTISTGGTTANETEEANSDAKGKTIDDIKKSRSACDCNKS